MHLVSTMLPYSEDELIIAIAGATVLLQRRNDLGRGVLGRWLADQVRARTQRPLSWRKASDTGECVVRYTAVRSPMVRAPLLAAKPRLPRRPAGPSFLAGRRLSPEVPLARDQADCAY